MSNSILIDTNVFVYAVDADSKFHQWALGVLSDSNRTLFTTSKNTSDFERISEIKIEYSLK
jgi:predicted nucleic acid-binding protein